MSTYATFINNPMAARMSTSASPLLDAGRHSPCAHDDRICAKRPFGHTSSSLPYVARQWSPTALALALALTLTLTGRERLGERERTYHHHHHHHFEWRQKGIEKKVEQRKDGENRNNHDCTYLTGQTHLSSIPGHHRSLTRLNTSRGGGSSRSSRPSVPT